MNDAPLLVERRDVGRHALRPLSRRRARVALACHFRLAAAEGAKIGLPEMHLGTVPAWGGSARLPRRIGRARALDMILRAKTVSGPEALRIGLVGEVWPNAELKGRTLEESLRDERAAVRATLGTPDQAEGMRAFLEQRKPVFNRG